MFSKAFPEEMTSGVYARFAADLLEARSPAGAPVAARGSQRRESGPGGKLPVENSLIQAAADGDLSAFNQLVLAYQDGLYGWVCSLVKDEAAAEDITQLTFITAFEKLRSFRGGSFRAWLFTIARNRSFDALRRKKRFSALSLQASPGEDEHDRLDILPDTRPLPEDALLECEQAAVIEQLLNRLPDAHQQVMRLVDMEGVDYREAAEILGLPLGTVKSRLTRGRLKMRELFLEKRWF